MSFLSCKNGPSGGTTLNVSSIEQKWAQQSNLSKTFTPVSGKIYSITGTGGDNSDTPVTLNGGSYTTIYSNQVKGSGVHIIQANSNSDITVKVTGAAGSTSRLNLIILELT